MLGPSRHLPPPKRHQEWRPKARTPELSQSTKLFGPAKEDSRGWVSVLRSPTILVSIHKGMQFSTRPEGYNGGLRRVWDDVAVTPRVCDRRPVQRRISSLRLPGHPFAPAHFVAAPRQAVQQQSNCRTAGVPAYRSTCRYSLVRLAPCPSSLVAELPEHRTFQSKHTADVLCCLHTSTGSWVLTATFGDGIILFRTFQKR